MTKIFVWLMVLCSSASFAAVDYSGRQVYVLQSGVDALWGSYLFLVSNPDGDLSPQSFKLMLPQETVDWAPQDGLGEGELKPAPQGGGVIVNKIFPKGDTLLAVGFKVPAHRGQATLTLKAEQPSGRILAMAKNNSLILSGEGLTREADVSFANDRFDAVSTGPVSQGQETKISVSGIQEGRRALWWVGAFAMICMAISAGIMTFVSRMPSGKLGV